jgi:hypothetical protein
VFHAEWFGRRYAGEGDAYVLGLERVLKSDCVRLVVVDLAISTRETADFTVAQVWDIAPAQDLILVHESRARAESPTIVRHLKAINDRFSPTLIGVEDVGYQRMMLQTLRQESLPVKALSTQGRDKLARSARAQVAAEQGQGVADGGPVGSRLAGRGAPVPVRLVRRPRRLPVLRRDPGPQAGHQGCHAGPTLGGAGAAQEGPRVHVED